jgi:hypothetical protein
MKLFGLAAVAFAAEKSVPPRHPLQRLARLTEFSEEAILQHWGIAGLSMNKQARWINKFATNAGRMEKNFERGNQKCGYYDENSEHGGPEETGEWEEGDEAWGSRKRRAVEFDVERYDRDDPCKGFKQITTGYRKWAERYLAACSGQKNHMYQANRMTKWNDLIQGFLMCM